MPHTLPNQGDLLKRLTRLNEIGVALSSVRNIDELVELILTGAKELTHADGGTVYTVTPEGTIRFELVMTDSLGIQFGGTSEQSVPFSEIPLLDDQGKPNDGLVVCYAAAHDKTVNIEDAYTETGYNFSGTRLFDKNTGYRSKSFLTVPMKDHRGKVIGVLQLINSTDPETKEVTSFSQLDQHLAESLASQAAVALTNHRLISDLNQMLEAFIQSIAHAIDQQSPHTSYHCQRVPVIANMIAEAVTNTDQGPLAETKFNDQDLYELRLAALLHDCGKVATPTHILEKSSRLQTVVDRIELIDQRFESAKQAAEIALLKKQLTAVREGCNEEESSFEKEYQDKLLELEEDRQFLHESNRAGVFMSGERQERVQKISEQRWSAGEDQEKPLLMPDEVNNLCIPRGTLNTDERRIMEDHVVHSIHMLRNLPYPEHLKRIPEIAGGHHEWTNGKGYPNGLTGEDLSLQAKILCIADVFEALTAKDRPYRTALPMERVLEILQSEVERGHIDRDVFEVFLREKVYLKYSPDCVKSDS